MKALFLTTKTRDCSNHVRAWESFAGHVAHVTYDHMGVRNDWQLVAAAEQARPDIIFHIGACQAPGNPKPAAFRQIRAIAPFVNIVSDAADTPWHPVLRIYRNERCFDLQVSIDGAKPEGIGLATLTPIDPAPFQVECERDIRCGFSGSPGRWNERSQIVRSLVDFGGLTLRDKPGSYEDHARFMRRCKLALNVSLTGSGLTHHIKGRVLEAGFAGCALLEPEGSPIGEWFPEGCWVSYRDAPDAARLIRELTDKEISASASALAREVRARYAADQIYGRMIEGVDRTVARPAA